MVWFKPGTFEFLLLPTYLFFSIYLFKVLTSAMLDCQGVGESRVYSKRAK